jgi:flagellar hook-associated protein 3
MRLQAMMSTGRRINQPSDDPIGTQKDLSYRKVLTEITQFKKNITNGLNLQATYDTTLGNLKDMVSSAYEVAVSLSNDTYDGTARQGAAEEVRSLFEQMVEGINSQVEGRYVFSGFRTKTEPFIVSSTGVNYYGDEGVIRLEMESSSKVDVNLIGSHLLFKQLFSLGESSDLKVGVDAGTLLADLYNGEGIDLSPGTFVVDDNNFGISTTIDVSTAVTLGDVITQVNNQLTAAGITGLTLDYGLEGNNLRWVATETGLISNATLLSNLNSGNGIDLSNGHIRIHDLNDTINVNIDLSSAANIGDIISTINSTLTANGVNNVTASINAAGTGINITDTNGVSLGLMIDEGEINSSTASDLGLLGNINPVLNGSALDPRVDFSVSEIAAGETTAVDLGLKGDFHSNTSGTALAPRLLLTTQLSLLDNGAGFDLNEIKISQGNAVAYVDFGNSAYTTVADLINAINVCGLDINASINEDETGIQIDPTINTASLIIEEVGSGSTAHEFGIFGSSDLLGSMIVLEKALYNDDREVVSQLIKNLNYGMQDLLNYRAQVGAKVKRLETTDSRLGDLEYNFKNLLSEVEDADLTKLVTDLAAQENSYQAALIATSKVIQPSLLNFLD